MSYDFMMMKPLGVIATPDELGEQTLVLQEPQAIIDELSRLYPSTKWERRASGGWFGSYEGADGWYEFTVHAGPDRIWSVATSQGAGSHDEIGKICRALGLIAFDGQTGELIRGAA